MKTTITYLVAIFTFVIYAQQNDDIRIFQSSNHQTENSIAIDPTNNDNILVSTIGRPENGKVHINYFYSHDRGITWNGSENTPNDVLTRGDPVAFFDLNGNAFIAYKGSTYGIKLIKSTNKGINWGQPIEVDPLDSPEADKEFVTADLSGVYSSNIYATWVDFNTTNYDLKYSRSTNSGNSFGGQQTLYTDATYYGHGPNITTGPNGQVYIVFARISKSGAENAIMFTKSTNGGQNFTTSQIAFSIVGIGPPNNPQGAFNGIRVNSFPSIDINRTTGRIFVVYADKSTGNSDVYLQFSDNQGSSWSGAVMVNSASSTQQWFPSISVDQSDGKVYVSYYNMDGSGYTTSHYVAVSADNGITFTRTKVSDLSFTPKPLGSGYANGYMGDYYEIKIADGYIFPCWSHDNNPEAKFQAYISPIGGAQINLDQKLSNNTTVDKIDFWSSSIFKELQIPKVYHFKPVINHILRGDQEILTNEKYNKWNVDNNVVNHRIFSFEISPAPQALTSQFSPTYSSMLIKNDLEASSINGGTISFIDPWLIDFEESPYGKRNRGMTEAYPWARNSPFYPDDTTNYNGDVYQGVFLNQFIEEGLPYYSVKATSPQPIQVQHSTNPPVTLTHNFYFQNWGGTNVEYEHADQLETGVVFTDENAVASANMKGTQLSSEETSYAKNSQRKFVRSDDGWLHCVYSSMGRVWYETSSNGGSNWEIMNGGKPLDNGEAKLPSIDYSSFYDPVPGETFYQIAIIFQENNSHKIRIVYFHRREDNPNYSIVDDKVVTLLGSSYASHDANPVIGFDHGNNITIVWQHTSSGLYGRYGVINYTTGITLFGTVGNHLSGTTMSSVTPTIYVSKSGTAATHLSWAQIVSEEQTEIKYAKMSGSNIVGNIVTASQGSGFSKNYNPSIIEINGGARICWIGFRDISRNEYRTVFKDPEYWRFWNFDNDVKSVNINKAPNYYALTWGRGNNYPLRYTISSRLSDPHSLSICGQDVQICNGALPSDVRAMAFNSNALPFYFTNSNIPLYKENVLSVGSGREGVVAKDIAQFYFAVGDIKVDAQPINFIEFDDTVSFYSAQRLNEFLVSEPFSLNNNSDFIYSVQYGITDSASAVSVLGNNNYINFKVELRDEQNGESVGLFDNITYTESNVAQYENIAYQVNTQGIGNRTVRLRLLVESNINPSYAITDRYAEENALLKSTTKQINYQGSLAVKEYALEQNYPNPFNPSTTINWQSPVGSHQTLKVYDVLGREVATLVNEWRDAGRYSIDFNASDLASGVYIYQLRVNDFVASKKLVLIK